MPYVYLYIRDKRRGGGVTNHCQEIMSTIIKRMQSAKKPAFATVQCVHTPIKNITTVNCNSFTLPTPPHHSQPKNIESSPAWDISCMINEVCMFRSDQSKEYSFNQPLIF